jgi:glycosyltransferase involved in cell wall biosynthesis
VKIVVLSPTPTYRGVLHAGGAYLYAHLEALAAAGNDVTFVVPGSSETTAHREEMPPSVRVVAVPYALERRPTIRSQWDRLRRRIRFASLDAPTLKGLRAAGFDRLAADADIVELHWVESAILTRPIRRARVTTPIVVVAHDVTAESVPSRAPSAGATSRFVQRVRRRTERADLRAADLVLVFKEDDRALLASLGIDGPTRVIHPELTVPDRGPAARRDGEVLFTGALWRPENHEGAAWFLREVWPAVVAEAPDATLTVAGADPPLSLTALADAVPNVTLTGTVPSLDEFYARASVFVAPLFVAGGLKFKVPQAMAYGLPVVATTVAAAGIDPAALWAITDDAAVMAARVVDALRDPAAAAARGADAAAWCRETFSFARSMDELVEAYRALARR